MASGGFANPTDHPRGGWDRMPGLRCSARTMATLSVGRTAGSRKPFGSDPQVFRIGLLAKVGGSTGKAIPRPLHEIIVTTARCRRGWLGLAAQILHSSPLQPGIELAVKSSCAWQDAIDCLPLASSTGILREEISAQMAIPSRTGRRFVRPVLDASYEAQWVSPGRTARE